MDFIEMLSNLDICTITLLAGLFNTTLMTIALILNFKTTQRREDLVYAYINEKIKIQNMQFVELRAKIIKIEKGNGK